MMKKYYVEPIGKISVSEEGFFILVDEKFKDGLTALDGFSHLNILYWFHHLDNTEARSIRQCPKPYKNAPEVMGVFATRSPSRPNPIALTSVKILSIDFEKGIITIEYIDADHDSPVIDIKPYTPSVDRIECPKTPSWCAHWPQSYEASGDFDWESEFMF